MKHSTRPVRANGPSRTVEAADLATTSRSEFVPSFRPRCSTCRCSIHHATATRASGTDSGQRQSVVAGEPAIGGRGTGGVARRIRRNERVTRRFEHARFIPSPSPRIVCGAVASPLARAGGWLALRCPHSRGTCRQCRSQRAIHHRATNGADHSAQVRPSRRDHRRAVSERWLGSPGRAQGEGLRRRPRHARSRP